MGVGDVKFNVESSRRGETLLVVCILHAPFSDCFAFFAKGFETSCQGNAGTGHRVRSSNFHHFMGAHALTVWVLAYELSADPSLDTRKT